MKRIITLLFAAVTVLNACAPDKHPLKLVPDLQESDLIGRRFVLEHGTCLEWLTFYDVETPNGKGRYVGYFNGVAENYGTCLYGSWRIDAAGVLQIEGIFDILWVEPWQVKKDPSRMLVNRKLEPAPSMFYSDPSYDMETDYLWNPRYEITDILKEGYTEIHYSTETIERHED